MTCSVLASRWWLVAALGALGSVACGDSGVVTTDTISSEKRDGALQDQGDHAGQPTTPDGPVDGPPPASAPGSPKLAQALTRAQQQALWVSLGEVASPLGGPGLEPDDLFLEFSDLGVECSSPVVTLPCGGHWSATLIVPPELQKVGLHDLSPGSTLSHYSSTLTETTKASDPSSCAYNGNAFPTEGSLEILSIDAQQVTFRLTTHHESFESDPSGTYTALRCAP